MRVIHEDVANTRADELVTEGAEVVAIVANNPPGAAAFTRVCPAIAYTTNVRTNAMAAERIILCLNTRFMI